ncbi:hypothetical protein VHEMI06065 [[Torrubiella] hemipterigena]|uniref:Endo-beta-N-acetylglucosaminidase EndoS/F2-like TIM-barrel domain-containing protein n=1 Tax=[Torrubiella] hemipterigena TaxID=1531966 RepID=A0A0A1SZM6_9HYPO|nr:hypothetical protein VHEMI06065 [[Torrubiella] hemipterigena]
MLLIYDTNQNGNTALFRAVYPYISYVLIQSTYMIGFTFYEENDQNRWNDTPEPFEKRRALQFANWQPAGATKADLFSYAVDRDGAPFGNNNLMATDYSWTRRLITAMNP